MKKKQNMGITLVALVITVIILLILAGITISSLSDNNLFKTTTKAKETYQIEEAKEALKLELSNLILDELGKKDLNKLDGLKIDGYNIAVSDIGKIVTMTKNNNTYYFLVDSEYNVQDLNNISLNNTNSSTGQESVNPGTSNLITQANLIINKIKTTSVDIKIEVPESEIENVVGYQVFINNEGKTIYEENEITVTGLNGDSQYNICVQLIDKNGGTKISNIETITTLDSYIYKRGDYREELTGGWRYSGGVKSSASHWTTYDDHMEITCPANVRTYITTQNKIDLTDLNKLIIVAETTNLNYTFGYITTLETLSSDPITFRIREEITTVDISNYTGEQYVHLSIAQGTLKIYEVYFE